MAYELEGQLLEVCTCKILCPCWVGEPNLGWMLVLGILMAVEKNVSWGRRLGRPLGVVLVLLGLAVALRLDARLW